MFNKKKILKSIIIITLIIIIFILIFFMIRKTNSKYETMAQTKREMDVAFWIVKNSFETQKLVVGELYPSATPFEYLFSVSNNDGKKRAETDIEYELSLVTTTNLPLEFEFLKNGKKCITKEEIFNDQYGTFYKKVILDSKVNNLIMGYESDVKDIFTLNIRFPKEYGNDEMYMDLIEDIRLELNAKQLIEE